MSCFKQRPVKESLAELRLLNDRLQEAASKNQEKSSAHPKSEKESDSKTYEDSDGEKQPTNAISYPEA